MFQLNQMGNMMTYINTNIISLRISMNAKPGNILLNLHLDIRTSSKSFFGRKSRSHIKIFVRNHI